MPRLFFSKAVSRADARALLSLVRGEAMPEGATPERHHRHRMGRLLRHLFRQRHYGDHFLPQLQYGHGLRHEGLADSEKQPITRMLHQNFAPKHTLAHLNDLSWAELLLIFYTAPDVERAFRQIWPADALERVHNNLTRLQGTKRRILKASVEWASAARVRGWVLDPHALDASIELDVCINHHRVARARAHLPRPDIAERFGGHGRYGFDIAFQIPTAIASTPSLWLELLETQSQTPLDAGRMVAAERATLITTIKQLSQAVSNPALDSSQPETQSLIRSIETRLPDLANLAAVPLEDYALYCDLYRRPATAPPASGPLFCFPEAASGSPLEASLRTQSYPHWSPRVQQADGPVWSVPLGAGDMLSPDALGVLAAHINQQPRQSVLTFDHDVATKGNTLTPRLFATPDLDRILARYEHSRAIAFKETAQTNGAHSTDADLLARLLAHVRENGETCWGHVPVRLARLHDVGPIDSPQALVEASARRDALARVVAHHLMESGQTAHVEPYEDPLSGAIEGAFDVHTTDSADASAQENRLAVIIPTRDGGAMLAACVKSLMDTANHPDLLDLVIVDNQSHDPATLLQLARWADTPHHHVVTFDAPFNWSAQCHRGAAASKAPYLLFLNDDTAALTSGWDTRLKGLLSRNDVGAVGARLLFENGTLQHAGITLRPDGRVVHVGAGDGAQEGLYLETTRLPHSVAAVTGAFLATRRDRFEASGGFDAQAFPITYNDIDYCFNLRREGLKILYTPAISFRHFESQTRGSDHASADKRARAERERLRFAERWGTLIHEDPAMPPLFSRWARPYRLLAAPSKAPPFVKL